MSGPNPPRLPSFLDLLTIETEQLVEDLVGHRLDGGPGGGNGPENARLISEPRLPP